MSGFPLENGYYIFDGTSIELGKKAGVVDYSKFHHLFCFLKGTYEVEKFKDVLDLFEPVSEKTFKNFIQQEYNSWMNRQVLKTSRLCLRSLASATEYTIRLKEIMNSNDISHHKTVITSDLDIRSRLFLIENPVTYQSYVGFVDISSMTDENGVNQDLLVSDELIKNAYIDIFLKEGNNLPYSFEPRYPIIAEPILFNYHSEVVKAKFMNYMKGPGKKEMLRFTFGMNKTDVEIVNDKVFLESLELDGL